MNQKNQGRKSDKFFIINMGVIVLIFISAFIYFFFKPDPPQQPVSFSLQELKTVPAFSTPHMTAKVLFDAIKEKDISRIKPCLLTENEFNQFYNIEPLLFSNQNSNPTINSYQNYLDHIENKFQAVIIELESLLKQNLR